MENITLNNGVKMPILGFGVFQIPDPLECEKTTAYAIQAGCRLIDTASAYQNEQAVGNAVRKSGIAREDFFITSKLWIQDAGYESAKKAFEKTLGLLQTDYLDLYLIHQPYGDVHGSWRAMEELYAQGKIRAIGLSNFQPDRVMDIIANNTILPAVNQIEVHPFNQQLKAHEFLTSHNIHTEAWGPFAEGRNNLFENKILLALAAKYNKSAAQVVLRWLIQRGITAIPKSVNPHRIEENTAVFDFELSLDDMNLIAGLDMDSSQFFDHRDPEMVKMLCAMRLAD